VAPAPPADNREAPRYVVQKHPTTEGDDVPVGDVLAVRSFGDNVNAFWIGRVVAFDGETLRVHWYEKKGDQFFEMDESDKNAFGEVEKPAIITRGKILTLASRLTKVAEREISTQLNAEKNDRMNTT
jgi:hypothetical protein